MKWEIVRKKKMNANSKRKKKKQNNRISLLKLEKIYEDSMDVMYGKLAQTKTHFSAKMDKVKRTEFFNGFNHFQT